MGIERRTRSIEELVVPIDLSKELEELGYDLLSPFYYNESGYIKASIVHSSGDAFIETDNYVSKHCIIAPLWDDVIKWFREVHNHYHPIYVWKHRGKPTLYSHITGERTEDYNQARLNRLRHLIEKLKEDNGKKSETT